MTTQHDLLRINLRKLRRVKSNAGIHWTPTSLKDAVGVDSVEALEQLIKHLRFTVELRSSNRSVARLSRFAHPGRLWIHGDATVLPVRGSTPTTIQVYAETVAMVDLRYTGSSCRTSRLRAAAEARAAALNAAAKRSLNHFIRTLNSIHVES